MASQPLRSETLDRVRLLAQRNQILISSHGFDELTADDITVAEAIEGLTAAIVIEDYPAYFKGPCVLVLQHDSRFLPLHVVWGIPGDQLEPAVLITAYRPDPALWEDDFQTRRSP
jgi:hypothetical protein